MLIPLPSASRWSRAPCPAPSRRRTLTALASAVLCCAAAALLPPPAATAAPALRSWSANVDPVLDPEGYGPTTTVADGRIWSLELVLADRALLRARSVRTGRLLASVRVAVPLLPGAAALGSGEDETGPQLVVSDGHAATSGTWCGVENDEERGGGDGCEDQQQFLAVFSTRTGRVLRSDLSETSHRLVGGDRPAELVRRRGASTALRDVVTGRTLMTVPRSASSVQAAGRYVSWESRDGERLHVRRLGASRDRFVLPMVRVTRAIGGDEPLVQSATLTDEGSIDLDVSGGDAGGHAVVVDGRGRVHRLPASLRASSGFSSGLRRGRVLLDLASDQGRCARASTWITDLRGRTGNHLLGVPVTRGRRLVSPPAFLPGGALMWEEESRRDEVPETDRIRVVPDVRAFPLTKGQRPRC